MRLGCLTSFVIVLVAPDRRAGSAQADMLQTHIGHIMESFKDTPKQQGLLPTALEEAKIATQHAALALKSKDNLDQMKLHAGHVIHAVDPTIEAKGPGLGYGVKKAAQSVAQHVELAASRGRVEGCQESGLVRLALGRECRPMV